MEKENPFIYEDEENGLFLPFEHIVGVIRRSDDEYYVILCNSFPNSYTEDATLLADAETAEKIKAGVRAFQVRRQQPMYSINADPASTIERRP